MAVSSYDTTDEIWLWDYDETRIMDQDGTFQASYPEEYENIATNGDGDVFLNYYDGSSHLTRINSAGTEIWNVSDEYFQGDFIVDAAGRLYKGAGDTIRCVNASNGESMFQQTIDGGHGYGIVLGDNGMFYAYDDGYNWYTNTIYAIGEPSEESVDLEVQLTQLDPEIPLVPGGFGTFEVVVTNHGPSIPTATLTLSIDPSDGVAEVSEVTSRREETPATCSNQDSVTQCTKGLNYQSIDEQLRTVYKVVFNENASVGGTYNVQASVQLGEGYADSNPNNNTSLNLSGQFQQGNSDIAARWDQFR